MLSKLGVKTKSAERYILAALAGILLALAFPKFSIAGLAWVAPGFLFFSTLGVPRKTAFRIGYFGGFIYYLSTLYWLLFIPVRLLPIIGWIALSAYLSLFTGSWVLIAHYLLPGEVTLHSRPWREPVRSLIANGSWGGRALWTLKCAAAWVALEIVLGRFLSGFPWDFLGVSQYEKLPIIQVSEYTGVYGVSFLIIWFSLSLLGTAAALIERPTNRLLWSRELLLPLSAIFLLAWLGIQRSLEVQRRAKSESTLKLALIQPSIPQTLIWDEGENETRFRNLLKLSEAALTNKPDILVWPEASVPNMVRHDQATADALVGLATRHKVWIIVGSDDAEARPGAFGKREVDFFNSAFAISPEGELTGIYRKRRLVIFGEYVPFVKWLPFLKVLSPAGDSGFTPGIGPVPFHLPSLKAVASVLICFEDTFPHVAREYVARDTDFLVNLTNNGWFGESAAQWQHAATAVFRAVENRIPLVRCANNGLTCWVDAAGGMHNVFFPDTRDIYGVGYKIVTVPTMGAGEERAVTFYTRFGDVFGWSCLALVSIDLLLRRVRGRKRALQDPAEASAA